MDVFLTWVIIIGLIISWYLFRIWRRSASGLWLRFRLTLIFILLVLVPSIPLLFIVSGLLTQGVEMFLLPGVEQALSKSLHVMKYQMEDRGRHFLTHFSDQDVNQQILQQYEISYFASYRMQNGTLQRIYHIADSRLITAVSDDVESLHAMWDGQLDSRVFQVDSLNICEVSQFLPDSTAYLVGYTIPRDLLDARNQMLESIRVYTSLSLLKRTVIEGRMIWGLATIMVIVLSIIAVQTARILSNGISQPINQLASGMQRVAEGDLSSQVDVQAKGEIKVLVDSFNTMASDLKASQEQLVQAERLAAWRDVARRISHEIKNILTPIQISLHRLRNKFPVDEEKSIGESLMAIDEEMGSLRRMADEFSQFARMPLMQRAPHDINQIISSLIPLIEGGTKPIRVQQELDRSLPQVIVDRDQIKRALHNLMKNSVEASPVGGTIEVRTREMNAQFVRIEIQDHGAGMDEETLAHIFEPYFTTKQRGMGLGMSIVKRIIEELDGKIEIESTTRKGTLIKIDLLIVDGS